MFFTQGMIMDKLKTSANEQALAMANGETLVLHVKKGFENRARHIEKMLGRMGIRFEYILDGDVEDITPDILRRYFKGDKMAGPYPHTSCALKHLAAYRVILERGLDGALVLEDDIFLKKNFIKVFNKSMEELDALSDSGVLPVIVSYEDTRLRFVPRSRRRKGVVLYDGDRDRMAGAYYINRAAASVVLGHAETKRVDIQIDLLHCALLRDGRLRYLWCQPTVATQGSHNGRLASGIAINKSVFSPPAWRLKLVYKKLLYWLR